MSRNRGLSHWLLKIMETQINDIEMQAKLRELQNPKLKIGSFSSSVRFYSFTRIQVGIQVSMDIEQPSLLVPMTQLKVAQLKALFPEECIADLGALWQRLQGKYKNRWLLKFIMFRAVVESFWAFYIQIKIENFSRPRKADTSQLRD